MSDEPRRAGSLRKAAASGTGYMVIGTLVAALGALGFQVVVARALGTDDFAPIAVLWTVQFLAFTTLFLPIEQLTIRRLNAATPEATPWRVFAVVIVGAVALAVAFTALALDRLLHGQPAYLFVVAALMVGYAGFALGRGFLAGNRRFREYGLTILGESVLRFVLGVVFVQVGVGTVGLAWTLVAGSLVVYVFRPFRVDAGRRSRRERGTGTTLSAFIAATSSSQTLVAAGPLAVGVLGGTRADVSIAFETFLVLRAPLTVAYSLIARVLPPFTAFVESGRREVLRPWVLRLGALGLFGAIAGFVGGRLLGPQVVAFLVGEEFRPPSTLAAHVGGGVAVATVALFTQQMLIAMRATTRLAAAWISGLAAAVLVIAVTGGTQMFRVGLGFLIGEIVAFCLILLFILEQLRGEPRTADREPRTD